MERYDIEKLRSLSCEGVAQRLGIKVHRHKALCCFHNDHTPSLTFRKNKFKCWSCGESGDTIKLAEKMLGKDFVETCRWLADEGPSPNLSLYGEAKPNSPLRGGDRGGLFDASRYARFFEHPFLNGEARKFLFEERRLDERVVRWCRLTSWKDKLGLPWLQIPYYNCEGKLVGIQNRNLIKGALPRFRFPQGSQCGIYNLPVLNLLKPGDELYIAEGCSDCWSLLSAGHKAIAIPSATLLTRDVRSKMEEVRGRFSIQFHMWPDRDEPGERLFLQLQKVLPSLVHHQLPPTCKDFSEYYLKAPSGSPFGGVEEC